MFHKSLSNFLISIGIILVLILILFFYNGTTYDRQNEFVLAQNTNDELPLIKSSEPFLFEYDDSQCYQFSWLVDYYSQKQLLDTQKNTQIGLKVNTNEAFKEVTYFPQIEQKYELIAFYPDHDGHLSMTTEPLESIEIEANEETKPLKFTRQAIIEIGDSNKHMDVGDFFLFSQEFSVPCIHFSNEQFHDASARLIDLKNRIITILTQPNPNGQEARYFLGAALHTLQDFYAHTNWVELGFREIDLRLGREIINNPPANMYTSPKITDAEILDLYIKSQKNRSSRKIDRFRKFVNYKLKYQKDPIFRQQAYQIAAAKSNKPGQLLPKFIGNKNKNRLTSGYFSGVGAISSCRVPFRKTRHGTHFFGCGEGMAKDEVGQGNYEEARRLAILATLDYVNQILESPQISKDIKATKTLMGITQ